MTEFVIGVSTSIFATFLLYFFRSAWGKYWHMLFSKVYPDVSGKYNVKFETENWREILPNASQSFTISQFGKSIYGEATVSSGSDEKLKSKITGLVTTSNCFVVNIESIPAENITAGSFVLQISGIEKKISGHAAWLCSECNALHNCPVSLEKIIRL